MSRAPTIARHALAGALVGGWACAVAPAAASPLEVDLNEELVAITTGFRGAVVDLFGATEGAGDVVVVVRGPPGRVVVRRKERVAGVWINAASRAFADVPGFYHVAGSAPIDALVPAALRERNQIGLAQLALVPAEPASAEEVAEFRAALIRNKQRQRLFHSDPGSVEFRGDRLFTTRIELPTNVPVGTYSIDVYLIANNGLLGRTTTTLQVRKLGFGSEVFDFAHHRSAAYGAIAIVIALVAGWFAGFVFRRI